MTQLENPATTGGATERREQDMQLHEEKEGRMPAGRQVPDRKHHIQGHDQELDRHKGVHRLNWASIQRTLQRAQASVLAKKLPKKHQAIRARLENQRPRRGTSDKMVNSAPSAETTRPAANMHHLQFRTDGNSCNRPKEGTKS